MSLARGPRRSGRTSILDRVPLDAFLLLAGPEGGSWLAGLSGLPAPVAGLRLTAELLPGLERWLAVAGIGPGGALLVRPDQHVAWRSAAAVRDPAGALDRVVRGALGLPGAG